MIENRNETVFLAALGATGSGAVIDLLREVKSYFVFEKEFRLFVDPGGLINLRHVLVEDWSSYQTDLAIKNFMKVVRCLNRRGFGPYSILGHSKYLDDEFIKQSEKYVENLTELKYQGLWYGIDNLVMRQLHKYRPFHRKNILMKPIYVGRKMSNEEFNHITEDYIRSLINYCLKKYKKQHFCFNENFTCFFPFKILDMVPGAKVLVVVRDPRDVLADTIKIKLIAMPTEIDQFIRLESELYKVWMEVEDEIKRRGLYGKTIKVIRFEDLILNYDDVVPELFEFFNIREDDHVEKRKFLNPDISIQNVKRWRRSLGKKDVEKLDKAFKPIYDRYGYEY